MSIKIEESEAKYSRIQQKSVFGLLLRKFVAENIKPDTRWTPTTMSYVNLKDYERLLNEAVACLNQHGFETNMISVCPQNIIGEIHTMIDSDGTVESPLTVHLESFGDFTHCHTLVVYMKNTGIGGELGFYNKSHDDSIPSMDRYGELHTSVDTHINEDGFRCVMFDENIWHGPLKFSLGERIIVSLHFRTDAPICH